MRKTLLPILALVLALCLALPMAAPAAAATVYKVEMYAGQNTHVGNFFILNDTNNLELTWVPNAGCVLVESHVDVVTDPADFPKTKKGNPKVGHFAYTSPDGTYVIPLSDIDTPTVGTPLHIAIHAVVDCCGIGEETAWPNRTCDGISWTDATPFGGKNWATYITYVVQ